MYPIGMMFDFYKEKPASHPKRKDTLVTEAIQRQQRAFLTRVESEAPKFSSKEKISIPQKK